VCFLEHNDELLDFIKAEDFLIRRMTVNCSWKILYHDGCLVDVVFLVSICKMFPSPYYQNKILKKTVGNKQDDKF